jgi:hypothetical protein
MLRNVARRWDGSRQRPAAVDLRNNVSVHLEGYILVVQGWLSSRTKIDMLVVLLMGLCPSEATCCLCVPGRSGRWPTQKRPNSLNLLFR